MHQATPDVGCRRFHEKDVECKLLMPTTVSVKRPFHAILLGEPAAPNDTTPNFRHQMQSAGLHGIGNITQLYAVCLEHCAVSQSVQASRWCDHENDRDRHGEGGPQPLRVRTGSPGLYRHRFNPAPPGAPQRKRFILAPSPDGQRQRPGGHPTAGLCHRLLPELAGVVAYNSSGSSFSSASEKTGPSTHTYLGPTLQRPQMPMPHFMRFSSVV